MGAATPGSIAVGNAAGRAVGRSRSGKILRFTWSERMLHWAIAGPFLVCYASAVILVAVYNPDPTRAHREVVSWIHRLSGVCLFVLPTLTLILHRGEFRTHLANIREAWVWTYDDLRWLARMGLAAVSDRFELPEQGKFNAAEKLNFMTVMTTYPVYILTGVLIWLPGIAFGAWVVHVSMAVLATPLVAGHVFMATVNPGTRAGLEGMVSGFVDRQWARHHYRRWYRERFEGGPAPAAPTTGEPGREPVRIRCPSCRATHELPSWAGFVRSVFSDEPLTCPGCFTEMRALAVLAVPVDLEAVVYRLDTGATSAPEPDRSTGGDLLSVPLSPRVS